MLEEYREYVMSETLATRWAEPAADAAFAVERTVEGSPVRIALAKEGG